LFWQKLTTPGLASRVMAILTKIGDLTNKTAINNAKNLQATRYYHIGITTRVGE
jgi:hypothetical protein